MSSIQEEGVDMWNKEYQKRTIQESKKNQKQRQLSWCGWVFHKIFKNLIYFFVVIIVMAFVGMIFTIAGDSADQMGIASLNSLHSTAGSGIDYKEIMNYLKFGESNTTITSSM
jgi:hypothetical protein